MIGPDPRSRGAEQRLVRAPDPTRPTPPVPAPLPVDLAARAERALLDFAAALRREAEGPEGADFDLLSRAVDGELDPAERALWEERVARDPHLARRAESLAAFRAELGDGTARVLEFRRKPARLSLAGWAAAAAVLLLAVLLREAPRLAREHGSASAAAPRLLDWSGEQLFADGFEAGDASGWSSVAPSG
jgi:anti-sigma factor RsiW